MYVILGSDFSKVIQVICYGLGFVEQFCFFLNVNWWCVVFDEFYMVGGFYFLLVYFCNIIGNKLYIVIEKINRIC